MALNGHFPLLPPLSVFCCHGKWLFCSVMCATTFGSGATSKGSAVWIFDGRLFLQQCGAWTLAHDKQMTDYFWEKNNTSKSSLSFDLLAAFGHVCTMYIIIQWKKKVLGQAFFFLPASVFFKGISSKNVFFCQEWNSGYLLQDVSL